MLCAFITGAKVHSVSTLPSEQKKRLISDFKVRLLGSGKLILMAVVKEIISLA